LKRTIALCLVIVFAVLSGNPRCLAADKNTQGTFTDAETASAYIKKNILFKSMKMEGENRKWKASLVVGRTRGSNGEYQPYMQLILTPKISSLAWTSYSVITNNGYITDQVWQIFKNPIVIKSDRLLPVVDETVIVCLKSSDNSTMDVLMLDTVIPPAVRITPSQAIRIFVEEYHSIYKKYPERNFSYEMELYNDNDWIVGFDDNDGIGGIAALFIDGKTGEPGNEG
jgi:hypothetical protein